jgi:hypothetical protein
MATCLNLLKRYANLNEIIREALQTYAREVIEGRYPDQEHVYHLKPENLRFLRKLKASRQEESRRRE